MQMPTTPAHLQNLTEEIRQRVGELGHIEDILQQSADEIQRAEVLLDRASRARWVLLLHLQILSLSGFLLGRQRNSHWTHWLVIYNIVYVKALSCFTVLHQRGRIGSIHPSVRPSIKKMHGWMEGNDTPLAKMEYPMYSILDGVHFHHWSPPVSSIAPGGG